MADRPRAVWRPLAAPAFARLFTVYAACFLGTSMLEATAAWDLAEQGASEVMVALVSSAATLPVVALIVPFGALADTGRRLRLVRVAQGATVLVCLGLALAAETGHPHPGWLILAVAMSGIAMAMRLPALTSMVPATLPERDLPDGMTLFGVTTSLTRFVGPAAAAGLIAGLGAPAPYALAAGFSLLALWLARGLSEGMPDSTLPAERVVGAIRVAAQFARQSPDFRRLLLRGAAFFMLGAAAQALAPLSASRTLGGGVVTFMAMIGMTGVGALLAGIALPRLRGYLRRTAVARLAALAMGAGGLATAFAPGPFVALVGALTHGAGWLWGLATFTSLAQQSLPEWVRARGMALAQAALIGGLALGAALWGQVATALGLTATLSIAAVGCLAMAAVRPWLTLLAPAQREIAPNRYWGEPALAIPIAPEDGPAVLVIEYRIRDGAEAAFLSILAESQRLRLRNGALSWSLFRDLEDPARFTEQVLYESWSDRLRQAHRTTEADALLRDRKLALLSEGSVPQVSHWVAVQP